MRLSDPSRAPRRLLILGLALALLVVLNAGLLAAAADYAYAGPARAHTDGERRLLALPLDAPAGSRMVIPAAIRFHDAGLAPWIQFSVVIAGTAATKGAGESIAPYLHWEAPLPPRSAVLKVPPPMNPDSSPPLEAVWAIDLASVPPEHRAQAELAFADRQEPHQIFEGKSVTYTAAWHGTWDTAIRFLSGIVVVAIIASAAQWTLVRRRAQDASPVGRLETLTAMAERATEYAIQLRNLLAVCVLLVASTGVLGFIAFGYFLSDWLPWMPDGGWDDVVVILLLVGASTMLVATVGFLVQAHQEVRRLRSIEPPM